MTANTRRQWSRSSSVTAASKTSLSSPRMRAVVDRGPCARVVDAPASAVGKNTPAQAAIRQIVNAAEVTQQLGRWSLSPLTGTSFGAVERSCPALALDDCSTEAITLPLLGLLICQRLRTFINEEQTVGNILSPAS